MTTGLSSELTEVIPLALVIALSPVSIIPAVLVLHAPRPRPSSLSFLAGWVVGLTALTAIFVGISGLLGGLHKAPPGWASWLRVIVGATLIVVGIVLWLTRQRHTAMPGWMRAFTGITPSRAAVTAAVLAVARPEVLLICAAAGLAIGTTGVDGTRTWISVAAFVAVAASSVAAPVLAYAAAGNRLNDSLARLKEWMERHHAGLVAVILIVIGIVVTYKGIEALAAVRG